MAKKNPRSAPAAPKPAPKALASPDATGPSFEWHHKIALVLAALAFLIYANTLGHGYVLDDPLAIGGNELVKKGFAAWPELLTTHYRQGTEGANASALLYRPLSLMAFAAEWAIAPNSAGFGHFMNVLWYALAVGMAFLALRRLLADYHVVWPLAGVALFATHPLHTEVVANIKSRDEIMAVFFGMLALYGLVRQHTEANQRKWLIISAVTYLLAMLSKESAVTLWPVFALVGWFFWGKKMGQSVAAALPLLGSVAVFLLLQRIAFAGVTDGSSIDVMDNPIVGASGFAERSATGFAVLWQYVRLLVWPHPLVCDYSYAHFPLATWADGRAWAGLVLVLGMAAGAIVGLMRRHPLAFFALAFGSGMVLYSQLLLVIGTLLGERLVFAPSLWWCAGVAFLFCKMLKINLQPDQAATRWPERSVTLAVVVGGIGLLWSGLTWLRNADWRDNLTLFETDRAKAPRSVRLHNGVSSELYTRWQANAKDTPEAERNQIMARVSAQARAAIAIKPNPVSYINLGNVALVSQQYDSSVVHYREALRVSPNSSLAKKNLVQALIFYGRKEGRERNNLPRAAELFAQAIELDGKNAESQLDLGTVYGMMGRNADALPYFERATQLDPSNKMAWRNLAAAHSALGNTTKAAEAAARAQ
jgi:protein O-mannosyl-transferase